jgi:hypothetical protein
LKTPAGFECRYFYANYYRGRSQQECRLIGNPADGDRWSPGLCRSCPVPRLLRANACRHLILEARVGRTWGGLGRKVEVSATCTKTLADVPKPAAGCGHCHEHAEKIFAADAK